MSAENSAVLNVRRGTDALLARDFSSYADGLAEDMRFEDRRSGVRSTHGKTQNVEQARVIADLGPERVDIDVLETRGDNTALCRQSWHVDDFLVVLLLVSRIDAEGKAVASILFDDEDPAAALAGLEVQAAS